MAGLLQSLQLSGSSNHLKDLQGLSIHDPHHGAFVDELQALGHHDFAGSFDH